MQPYLVMRAPEGNVACAVVWTDETLRQAEIRQASWWNYKKAGLDGLRPLCLFGQPGDPVFVPDTCRKPIFDFILTRGTMGWQPVACDGVPEWVHALIASMCPDPPPWAPFGAAPALAQEPEPDPAPSPRPASRAALLEL